MKLVQWALGNPEDWAKICGLTDEKLTREEFDRLSFQLQSLGFHEIRYVLYTRYAKEYGPPDVRNAQRSPLLRAKPQKPVLRTENPAPLSLTGRLKSYLQMKWW